MTSKKKLVKEALKHPSLYSWAELVYFKEWLKQRKRRKDEKKKEQKD